MNKALFRKVSGASGDSILISKPNTGIEKQKHTTLLYKIILSIITFREQ